MWKGTASCIETRLAAETTSAREMNTGRASGLCTHHPPSATDTRSTCTKKITLHNTTDPARTQVAVVEKVGDQPPVLMILVYEPCVVVYVEGGDDLWKEGLGSMWLTEEEGPDPGLRQHGTEASANMPESPRGHMPLWSQHRGRRSPL